MKQRYFFNKREFSFNVHYLLFDFPTLALNAGAFVWHNENLAVLLHGVNELKQEKLN